MGVAFAAGAQVVLPTFNFKVGNLLKSKIFSIELKKWSTAEKLRHSINDSDLQHNFIYIFYLHLVQATFEEDIYKMPYLVNLQIKLQKSYCKR